MMTYRSIRDAKGDDQKPLELETEAINATWRAPVANDDAQRLKDAEAFMNAYKRDLAATDRRYGWDMALLVYPENPTDLDYGVHRWSIETLKIRTGKAMFMAHIHYDASIEGMQLSNSAGRSSHIQVMFTALYRLYCKNDHISAKKYPQINYPSSII